MATVLAFWGVWTFDFTNYDDDLYIVDNPRVVELSAANAAWALTSFHGSLWIPVTWLSFMVDAELWGGGAGGYHFTNLVLHVASALLVFRFFATTTSRIGRSAFVAGLFALHPLRVESVAWVTERKDVLSGLFGVLCLLAYARWSATGRRPLYVVALVCLALGLMAKPVLVTLPFLLLLLDWWPLARLRGRQDVVRRCVEKVPFLLLAVAAGVVALIAPRDTLISLSELGFGSRLANASLSYGGYVASTLWPVGLAVAYPHRILSGLSLPLSVVVGLALLGASVAAARQRFARPWLPVGWFWFLGVLVPMSGIFQVGAQSGADRFTYLPSIGLSILLAWGGWELCERLGVRPRLTVALAVTVVAGLGVATWLQTRYWRDSETLFRRSIAVTGGSATAHYNLAQSLSVRGELDAAVPHYEAALDFDPDHVSAYSNLGLAEARLGRKDRALALYAEALARDPQAVQTWVNLGVLQAEAGDLEAAEASFREALRVDDTFRDARFNLALALAQRGDFAAARREAQALVEVDGPHGATAGLLERIEAAAAVEQTEEGEHR